MPIPSVSITLEIYLMKIREALAEPIFGLGVLGNGSPEQIAAALEELASGLDRTQTVLKRLLGAVLERAEVPFDGGVQLEEITDIVTEVRRAAQYWRENAVM